MKFKLKEDVVTVRDQSIPIRELSHAERLKWMEAAKGDQWRAPRWLIAAAITEPTTEEEILSWPDDVVTQITEAVMKLSNMNTKQKENSDKKQP